MNVRLTNRPTSLSLQYVKYIDEIHYMNKAALPGLTLSHAAWLKNISNSNHFLNLFKKIQFDKCVLEFI